MSSRFVCANCGCPVTTHREAWRHALGRNTGVIPKYRKHRPVPVERAEFEYAYATDTPVETARKLVAGFKELDEIINGSKVETVTTTEVL